MGRSFRIGTVAGISIRVHWTFLLLVGFVLFTSLTAGQNVPQALTSVGFVLVLFGCIALHELGHALAARWFGIPTQDITLLPIGGVARLARMPRRPLHELVVAVAGPMVNVAIAVVLFASLWPISDIAEQVIGGTQRSFPVVRNGTVIGMLGREDVIRSLNHEGNLVVSDVMRTNVQPVSDDEALETVVERLSETGRAAGIVPVLSDGTLVGLLDPGLMFELVEARARLPREEPILATVVEPRPVASGAST